MIANIVPVQPMTLNIARPKVAKPKRDPSPSGPAEEYNGWVIARSNEAVDGMYQAREMNSWNAAFAVTNKLVRLIGHQRPIAIGKFLNTLEDGSVSRAPPLLSMRQRISNDLRTGPVAREAPDPHSYTESLCTRWDDVDKRIRAGHDEDDLYRVTIRTVMSMWLPVDPSVVTNLIHEYFDWEADLWWGGPNGDGGIQRRLWVAMGTTDRHHMWFHDNELWLILAYAGRRPSYAKQNAKEWQLLKRHRQYFRDSVQLVIGTRKELGAPIQPQFDNFAILKELDALITRFEAHYRVCIQTLTCFSLYSV